MANFLQEVINANKLNDCNDLLDHAEEIIGTTIINRINDLTKELDELMDMMHKKINKDGYEISDKELEKLIIRLPNFKISVCTFSDISVLLKFAFILAINSLGLNGFVI